MAASATSSAQPAEHAEWLGLEIVRSETGEGHDEVAYVEFVAHYREDGLERRHSERSRFRWDAGRWYYVDGETPKPLTQTNAGPKIGRNDPCPCGSGRKFKKCCGA